MDKRIKQELLIFIKSNELLVKENKWDEVYNKLLFKIPGIYSENITYLSELLLQLGFNPLYYMRTVPAGFLYNSNFNGNIHIPSNIEIVGDRAFFGCDEIKTFTIDNGVERIGETAFKECTSIKNIYIPDSVESMGENTFLFCKSLSHIDNISKRLTKLPPYAFYGCDLKNIHIPGNIKIIGKTAFGYNKNMVELILDEGVEEIGERCFVGCDKIKKIILPISLKSIGDKAFNEWTSLTDVYYNGSRENWANVVIGNNNDAIIDANIHFNK